MRSTILKLQSLHLNYFWFLDFKNNFLGDASVNDRSATGKLEGSQHFGIIFCVITFLIIGTFGIIYYKQLLCFAKRRNRWHGTSVVGFTNLSHENGS